MEAVRMVDWIGQPPGMLNPVGVPELYDRCVVAQHGNKAIYDLRSSVAEMIGSAVLFGDDQESSKHVPNGVGRPRTPAPRRTRPSAAADEALA